MLYWSTRVNADATSRIGVFYFWAANLRDSPAAVGPRLMETVSAALLRVQTLPDGPQIGRIRYGNRYLVRPEAVALYPFRLPLAKEVF